MFMPRIYKTVPGSLLRSLLRFAVSCCSCVVIEHLQSCLEQIWASASRHVFSILSWGTVLRHGRNLRLPGRMPRVPEE